MGGKSRGTPVFCAFLLTVKSKTFYPSRLPYFLLPLTPCNRSEIQLLSKINNLTK
jgi:hypothetical protein